MSTRSASATPPATTTTRRPSRPLPLLAGGAALALVAACCALGWPADAPVRARPGGEIAGDDRLAWAFLVCAAGAVAAYAAGVALLARRAARAAAVVVVGAALQLVPLAAPLLLSTDAWTYWHYGRAAAVHGENPYRTPPAELAGDPSLPFVGADWRDTTTVYGPAFTLASEPLALAAGESADVAAWTFKALAAAAVLAAALLAARLSPRRELAFATVAWNPVLALHLAGGGHNDALVALLVVGALALGASGRAAAEGAAWAVGALVKWLPLLLLPLRLLGGGRASRVAAGFAVAVTALAAVATWRYGTGWLEAAAPLLRNAERETSYAIPHRLAQVGVPRPVALGLAGAAFAVVYAWLAREARRGRMRLGVAAAAFLLTTPYLTPWYLAWLAPLAAAEDDVTARRLTLALSAYLLPQTIPT